jgi:hypothetical protein
LVHATITPRPTDIAKTSGYGRIMSRVEIVIGLKDSPRELALHTDGDTAQVRAAIAADLEGGAKLLTLEDRTGRTFLIPTAAIAYVEVGTTEARRVGFGA